MSRTATDIREARGFGDLIHIKELLQESSLPLEGLEETRLWVAVGGTDRSIVGCAGVEVHGRQGLLRSVAVKRSYQKKGVGTSLVRRVVQEAWGLGIVELYLLTDTAEPFFKKEGFTTLSEESKKSFTGPVKESEEFQGACMLTAALMVKKNP